MHRRPPPTNFYETRILEGEATNLKQNLQYYGKRRKRNHYASFAQERIERLSVITGGLQTLRTIFHYFEFLEYCGVFRVQLHGIIWRGYDTSLDLDDIIQGINPCTLLLC